MYKYDNVDLLRNPEFYQMTPFEGSEFLPDYIEHNIIKEDPFQSLDVKGVGQLVEIGVSKGRTENKKLKIGICGEHGGDPKSVNFFNSIGLDYVSCSPFRVPIAILAAAKSEL